MRNQSVVPCPVLTVASWPAYRFFRRQVRWSGTPISWRIFQFVVIYTVKGFGIVNEAEVDVFLEFCCFFSDSVDVGKLILVPLPFLNPAWTSGSSQFTDCWSLAWTILSITLLVCESKVKLLSCVPLFVTPQTVAYQAPPSMGFFQARVLEWGAISFSKACVRS